MCGHAYNDMEASRAVEADEFASEHIAGDTADEMW